MPSLLKPSPAALQRSLDAQQHLPSSFPFEGATAGPPPVNYQVDHTRARLGSGEDLFESACHALRRWDHFRLGWVDVWPQDSPLRRGALVAVVGRVAGLWWTNACRVADVWEGQGTHRRFGYAYVTLPSHMACGEERFEVRLDRSDLSVTFDILAYSRPRATLAWLAYPLLRVVQKRFGRDAAQALFHGSGRSGSPAITQRSWRANPTTRNPP